MITKEQFQQNRLVFDQAAEISRRFLGGQLLTLDLPGQQLVDPASEAFRDSHPIRHHMFLAGREGLKHESFNGFTAVEVEKLRQLNSLQDYLKQHFQDAENRTLREGQDQTFAAISRFLERGGQTGYIVLPTRSGKTVIFLEFLEALQSKALIVTPSKFLVRQTKLRKSEFAPDLDLALHYGAKKEGLDHDVVVTTKDSFVAMVKRGDLKPGMFPTIILDEAHEFLTELKESILEPFIAQDTVIGFTATDEYDAEKNVRRLLSNEIHRLSIPEAVTLGLNCPFKVMTVETEVDLSDVRTAYSRGDYNRRDIDKAINQASLNSSAVQLYQAHFADQVGICNVGSVRHAKALARAFRDAGISARAVWGKMKPEHFKSAVRGHQSGKVKIITNVDLFTRGYDNELMTFAFNITPTLSLVVAGQRGGRPLTVDPANADKLATIVEFLHEDSSKRRRQQTFVDFTHVAYLPAPSKTGRTLETVRPPRTKDVKVDGLKVSTDPETVLSVINRRAARSEVIKKKVPYESDSVSLRVKKSQRAAERVLMKLPLTTLYLGAKLSDPEKTQKRVDDIATGLYGKIKERIVEELGRLQESHVPLKQLEVIADMNAELLIHFESKFRELSLRPPHFAEIRVQVERAAQQLEAIVVAMQNEVAPSIDGYALLTVFDPRAGIYEQQAEVRRSICSDEPEAEISMQQWLGDEIKNWEKHWHTRWDLFIDAYKEVRSLELQSFMQRDELVRNSTDTIAEGAFRFTGGAMPLDELKLEALIAVEEAAEQFCMEHTPHRFATIAAKAIDTRLSEVTRQNNLATGEIHGTREFRSTVAAIEQHRLEFGHDPDARKLAQLLGIKISEAADRLLLLNEIPGPVQPFSQLEMLEVNKADEYFNDDDEYVWSAEHFLPEDPNAINPVDLFSDNIEVVALLKSIVTGTSHQQILNDRQRAVLQMRFGLTEEFPEPMTLQEVGDVIGVGKEMIRQNEATGIMEISRFLQSLSTPAAN